MAGVKLPARPQPWSQAPLNITSHYACHLVKPCYLNKTVAGPHGRATAFQLIYTLKISVHEPTILTDLSPLIILNNFKLT